MAYGAKLATVSDEDTKFAMAALAAVTLARTPAISTV